MKIDVDVGIIDSSILDWYDNASKNDVTNALYHGFRVVSNPEYSKKLDSITDNNKLELEIQVLRENLEMYKEQIRKNQEIYNEELDKLMLDTKVRYEKEYKDRIKEKDDRINDINNSLIPQLLSDKERLINEKNERIEIQLKVQSTLENELSMTKERCNELENIMSNSTKKGAFAENKLTEMLSENISDKMSINLISKRAHSTDIHIASNEYEGVILVESKFYTDKDNIYKEVEKFYKDIDKCKSKMEVFSAIFVSYTCDIPKITDNFKCIDEKGIRCYYFANMTDDKFSLLYQIVELEHLFYKQQKISEGNESMNQYLMRMFKEISENYKRIEDLSPGYVEIKKVVEKEETRYNRALKKIINDIKLKSDTFTKLTNIDSANSVDVVDILNVASPHELNIPQWDSFKEELIMVRIEKNELLKTQEERDILQLELGERQNIIKELEKKVEAKVTRKPKKKKGDESARGADGV